MARDPFRLKRCERPLQPLHRLIRLHEVGLSKQPPRLLQGGNRATGLDRHGQTGLAQLLPVAVQHQRKMRVLHCGQSQALLQQSLPRTGVQQVGAAHDMGHALFGIIDHHRELVSPKAIGAAQYEITNVFIDALNHAALDGIVDTDFALIWNAQAKRGLIAAWRGDAASMNATRRRLQVGATAATRKDRI